MDLETMLLVAVVTNKCAGNRILWWKKCTIVWT
jgi:hypothetical protein